MILLIDNYDSFSYNLYQLVGSLSPDIQVVRNDQVTVADIREKAPSHLIVSPGPGRPADAGVCEAAIRELSEELVWELSEELVLSPAQAAMDRARHRARTRARIFLMISLLLYRWGARFSRDRPGIENGPIILSAWGKVNQTGGKRGRL